MSDGSPLDRDLRAPNRIEFMTRELTDSELLQEIDGVAADELDRHIEAANEWFPHEFIPWDEGTNFAQLGGREWDASQSRLPPLARDAMVLNLLSEDNLPSYHYEVSVRAEGVPAMQEWIHRWTAEENRHAIAMRDYLVVTRAVDPRLLEQMRMAHMTTGWRRDDHSQTKQNVVAGMTYTAMQELATRISHRNTGRACADPVADAMLGQIARDENLHMLFYRNVIARTIELAPDQAIEGIVRTMETFEMPGVKVDGFRNMAVKMAWGNIYNVVQHRNEVVLPLIRHWNLLHRSDYSPRGEVWRDRLNMHLEDLDSKVGRFNRMAERRLERERSRI